jgi:hypothetical protein
MRFSCRLTFSGLCAPIKIFPKRFSLKNRQFSAKIGENDSDYLVALEFDKIWPTVASAVVVTGDAPRTEAVAAASWNTFGK